jgi:hypothetical protein
MFKKIGALALRKIYIYIYFLILRALNMILKNYLFCFYIVFYFSNDREAKLAFLFPFYIKYKMVKKLGAAKRR